MREGGCAHGPEHEDPSSMHGGYAENGAVGPVLGIGAFAYARLSGVSPVSALEHQTQARRKYNGWMLGREHFVDLCRCRLYHLTFFVWHF